MLHWGQLLIIWHWNDEKLSFFSRSGKLGFSIPSENAWVGAVLANVPQMSRRLQNVPQMSRKCPAGSKMSRKCPANVPQTSRRLQNVREMSCKCPANVSRRLGHIFLVQSSRRAEISVLKASRPILFRYWNFSVEVPLTRSAVVATKPLE